MTTFGLVMIVKDEAAIITDTLARVRPHISHWTVLDTGSTDGTQDVVRAALEGIPGDLHEAPFVDFGTTRSRAFGLARGWTDWLLALDADMAIEIDLGFEPVSIIDAYMIAMGSDDFAYRLPLVLRGSLEWISVGAVHEYTMLADGGLGRRAPTDMIRVAYPDGSSPAKTAWHKELLEADLARDPTNPRTVFYLAQTLRELGDPRALFHYRQRVSMGGFEEERFYAAFQVAMLSPTWPARLLGLMSAWEMRPWRLEPLYELVKDLNANGQHATAWALTHHLAFHGAALELPDDVLFVHTGVWRWGLAFERSIACWWAGGRAEFERLSHALIAVHDLPPSIREAVERNLTIQIAA